ncbi:glycosyltransferase [Vibrio kasasachensis]|uniref:glycosyltransferase n=1 Tax=Vibrio kasasachensis TaxID=2910248 RepID=UPI003D115796
MKYSVIVPIYNTFDYAKKIIDWFLIEQASRQQQDIELILVDDGSKQAARYPIDSPAIKLVRKENGGVSSARNCGVEQASGKYILFLDSDDSFELGIFAYLDDVLVKQVDIDSILFSFRKILDTKITTVENHEQKVTSNCALSQFLTKEIRIHVCGLMVSRRLLIEHNLRFDESLHFSEDVLFIIEYLSIAQQCFISGKPLYNHVLRQGSAINSPLKSKDTTHIDAFERISYQAKKKAFESDVNLFMSTCYINLLKFLVKNKTSEKEVFDKIISNSHFLFGKTTPRLSRYSVIVFTLRVLFKFDGLFNHYALRKISIMR